MLNSTELIGYIAGALTTFAFVPQVVRLYRLRHSRDISLPTFSMFGMGVVFWLTYGMMLRSWPIIMWNAITLVLAITVVILTIKYRRSNPSDENSE